LLKNNQKISKNSNAFFFAIKNLFYKIKKKKMEKFNNKIMKREFKDIRKTNETEIEYYLNIDGSGIYNIDIPIGFLKHMLELFTRHGLFDINLTARGDIEVDFHHTVEDIGICLGMAFNKALGDKRAIKRYGFFLLPMDEAIAEVAVDISNRPLLIFNAPALTRNVGDFDVELIREFWEKFTIHAKITLHINLRNCANIHHGIEAIFKCAARALDMATSLDNRYNDIPSTKGIL